MNLDRPELFRYRAHVESMTTGTYLQATPIDPSIPFSDMDTLLDAAISRTRLTPSGTQLYDHYYVDQRNNAAANLANIEDVISEKVPDAVRIRVEVRFKLKKKESTSTYDYIFLYVNVLWIPYLQVREDEIIKDIPEGPKGPSFAVSDIPVKDTSEWVTIGWPIEEQICVIPSVYCSIDPTMSTKVKIKGTVEQLEAAETVTLLVDPMTEPVTMRATHRITSVEEVPVWIR